MTEKSKYLSEHYFNPAIEKAALKEAFGAVASFKNNPTSDRANEELNNALDKVIAAVNVNIFGPSPKLSDNENDLYIALKRKKIVVRRTGIIEWYDNIKLDDDEESLFQSLEAKAETGEVLGKLS